MFHRIVLIFILFYSLSPPPVITAGTGFSALVKEVWTKFWSISCYFSTPAAVLARSKRSTIDWLDVHDADQVFDFLYPSADVKLEDYYDYLEMGESSKSANIFQSRSLLSWMDSLVDVWQTQCRLQRQHHHHHFPNSSKKQVPRTHSSEPQTLNELTGHENVTAAAAVNLTSRCKANGTTKAEGTKLLPQPTNASAISQKIENNWFSSYGGDIEYFFPLIGFGIPFDGEITLLGFHGFKGVFPYK